LAVDSANQFIKENPVHKKLDYVYYVLGLAHFDEENNRFENLLRIDRNKRPQNDMQDAMEYFQTLVNKYPNSEYVTDANQRIVFIRERLAAHDLSIAQYYVRRGIYIAAANRAKNIIENYPDTQAARQALNILEVSYNGMGMTDLAADVRRVKQNN
jgi:outer membrane protein assembly factor BamD